MAWSHWSHWSPSPRGDGPTDLGVFRRKKARAKMGRYVESAVGSMYCILYTNNICIYTVYILVYILLYKYILRNIY